MEAEVPCNLTPRHPPRHLLNSMLAMCDKYKNRLQYITSADSRIHRPYTYIIPHMFANQIIYHLAKGVLGACR
jgi:hypothetical protein